MSCYIDHHSEKKWYLCIHFTEVSTSTEYDEASQTPRDTDKLQSGWYAAIPLKILLSHTTLDKEKPLHYKTNKPIEMGYLKSG